jgi:hypothetical protein
MKRMLLLIAALGLSGCASYYNAPGGAADMTLFGVGALQQAALTDPAVASRMDKRPAATLPTVIAVAHVQGSGYTSYSCSGYGQGRYSVITSLDSERPEDLDRLRKLSMVRDVALINRLVLPKDLNSDLDLRAAAGALHADMLFVYTYDTTFRNDDFAGPLMVVTLGIFPGRSAKVSTTASGVLLDTRTGYIYATATGHSNQSQLANAWTSSDAADDARRRAEHEALGDMLTSLEQTWPRLVMDSPSWRSATAAPGVGTPPAPADPSSWSWGAPSAPGNTYRTVPRE